MNDVGDDSNTPPATLPTSEDDEETLLLQQQQPLLLSPSMLITSVRGTAATTKRTISPPSLVSTMSGGEAANPKKRYVRPSPSFILARIAAASETKGQDQQQATTTTTTTTTSKASAASASAPSSLLGRSSWLDRLALAGMLVLWYTLGVMAIVSTKTLVQEWHCPPLLLTVQQMVLASVLLRLALAVRDGAPQPLPWESSLSPCSTSHITKPCHDDDAQGGVLAAVANGEPSSWRGKVLSRYPAVVPRVSMLTRMAHHHSSFVLVGIFNALEFLCSNLAFSIADADFVETVKASDPITSAAIAVIAKVDQLSAKEGVSLLLLVGGILLSTWSHCSFDAAAGTDQQPHHLQTEKLVESAQTTGLTLLCFGFHALRQKKYRSIVATGTGSPSSNSVTTTNNQSGDDDAMTVPLLSPTLPPPLPPTMAVMDDVNLLYRMVQIGAAFLALPMLLMHGQDIWRAVVHQPLDVQTAYCGVVALNSCSYVVYNLSSCYVLGKLTAVQSSSLNCLRRMVLILATSIYFRTPLSKQSLCGLLTILVGFGAFTYYRNQREGRAAAVENEKKKDSNV